MGFHVSLGECTILVKWGAVAPEMQTSIWGLARNNGPQNQKDYIGVILG